MGFTPVGAGRWEVGGAFHTCVALRVRGVNEVTERLDGSRADGPLRVLERLESWVDDLCGKCGKGRGEAACATYTAHRISSTP